MLLKLRQREATRRVTSTEGQNLENASARAQGEAAGPWHAMAAAAAA